MSDSFDPFDNTRTSVFRARWRDNHGTWLLIYTALIGVLGVIVMAVIQPGGSGDGSAAGSRKFSGNFAESDQIGLPALSDPLAGPELLQDRLLLSNSDVANSRVAGSTTEFMVAVSGAESDKGSIRIAIYGSSETFPKEDEALFKDTVPIENGFGYCPVPIAELPAMIAIAAYHDENDNGQLDRGLLGIPVEAYGFTNRGRGITGPPSFESVALEMPPAGSEVYLPIR